MASSCAIAAALDVFGDRWSMLVIRDVLYHGKTTYSEFLESPEGISTNILADRLRKLEAAGLIKRKAYQSNPVRYAYRATKAGKAVKPVLKAAGKWGVNHVKKTAMPA